MSLLRIKQRLDQYIERARKTPDKGVFLFPSPRSVRVKGPFSCALFFCIFFLAIPAPTVITVPCLLLSVLALLAAVYVLVGVIVADAMAELAGLRAVAEEEWRKKRDKEFRA